MLRRPSPAAWHARAVELAREGLDPQLSRELSRPVEEFELLVGTFNGLKESKIETIGDLVEKTEAGLVRTRIGRKSLDEIKELLMTMGLSLGMELPAGWRDGRGGARKRTAGRSGMRSASRAFQVAVNSYTAQGADCGRNIRRTGRFARWPLGRNTRASHACPFTRQEPCDGA